MGKPNARSAHFSISIDQFVNIIKSLGDALETLRYVYYLRIGSGMAAITPSAGYPRAARALLLLVTLCTTGSFFAGCDQYNSQPRQIDGLKADLDEARRR